MTRAEAKDLGLTKYQTGEPCRRGHTDGRYTRTGACIGCIRDYNRRAGGSAVRVTVQAHPDDESTIRRTAEALAAAREESTV